MVGAEGFEPSNTGSKGRRLTAWPRPNTPGPGAPAPRTLRRGVETLIVAEVTAQRQPCAHIRGGATCECGVTATRAVQGRSQCVWPRRRARTGRKRRIRSPTWPQTWRRRQATTGESDRWPGDVSRPTPRDRCAMLPTTPASPEARAAAAAPAAGDGAPRRTSDRRRLWRRRNLDGESPRAPGAYRRADKYRRRGRDRARCRQPENTARRRPAAR